MSDENEDDFQRRLQIGNALMARRLQLELPMDYGQLGGGQPPSPQGQPLNLNALLKYLPMTPGMQYPEAAGSPAETFGVGKNGKPMREYNWRYRIPF
jgi:hypothetical protein